MVHFVLGGARSGKSDYAQKLAEERSPTRVYVATGEALDDEMAERIRAHKGARGAGWTTVEAPLDLPAALGAIADEDASVVVDCLTLWLSNLMHHGRAADDETDTLLEQFAVLGDRLFLVSNEVGLGLVPDTPLGRTFRDAQGRLNRRVAEVADRVTFVAAGLPLTLKR